MFRSMTSKYFNGKMTAQTMKTLYRNLVRQYHPDLNPGISDDTIKQINNEYSYWYARAASEETYTTKTEANPDKDYSKYRNQEYIDSLENMIKWILENNIDLISGIEVELIGVFIWIGGIKPQDVDIRNKVKGIGFQGGWKITNDEEKVYMWKWTPEIKRFKSNPNIDSIRDTYGSERVKRQQKQLA